MLVPIKVYDAENSRGSYITKRKNFKRTSVLNDYDKTIQFSFPTVDYSMACEDYAEFEGELYVIKEISPEKNGFRDVTAVLCLEELENKVYTNYSRRGTAPDILADLVAGTGWSVNCTTEDDAELTISGNRTNAKNLIGSVKELFCLEIRYDNKNKIVYAADQIGTDRGMVFLQGINMAKVEDKVDTYDYCTRLIPIGKNGIDITSVNNGKNYIDAEGARKVITQFFVDETYETPETLLKVSRYKLDEASKPNTVITAKILDLYRLYGARYQNYFYGLGDTVGIVSEKGKLSGKYRIAKMVEYPDAPEKNTVELANRTKSFEDYAKKIKAMMQDVEDHKIVISGMNEISKDRILEICS